MFNKILILSASAGAGHTKAGQALEKAFQSMGAAREIRHEDSLRFTRWWFRLVYSWGYWFTVQHMPSFFGFLFRISDHPWKNEMGRYLLDRIHAGPLVRLIRQEQPDWLVTTHFLPPHLTSRLKISGQFQGKLAVVVTDFDVHAYWLCRHYDHYFVALDQTRIALERVGIDPRKITVSGIPIDPAFAVLKEKALLCNKHELTVDRPIILVSTGASAIGPVKELVQDLLHLRNRAQLVVICGNNRPLRREMQQVAGCLPVANSVQLKVVGYTNEMDEWMTVGDILVGKPGGLTTSEALAKGMAFMIFNPIPGQEERNADHLIALGAGVKCLALSAVREQIDSLLANPERLRSLQEQAKAMGHPAAASSIVRKLIELSAIGEGKLFSNPCRRNEA
jgi:processive 1,2-diacylglycerol beta-glucosyltransferase